jgi:DNA-binding transcriptional regulator LsrR (DeoR family)
MFAVEIYAAVRRFVFVEGKTRREAARVFGLSRGTITKMCRFSAPPGYVRSKGICVNCGDKMYQNGGEIMYQSRYRE